MVAQQITVIFHREAVASVARALAVHMSRPLVGVTTLRFASMERAGRHRSTANRFIAFLSIRLATKHLPDWTHWGDFHETCDNYDPDISCVWTQRNQRISQSDIIVN